MNTGDLIRVLFSLCHSFSLFLLFQLVFLFFESQEVSTPGGGGEREGRGCVTRTVPNLIDIF